MRASRRIPPLASAILLAGCATAVTSPDRAVPHPDVNLRERTVRYDVPGATLAEVSASLNESAPRIEGRPFRGTTHWDVRWRFRYGPSGSACGVTGVDVDLFVTTTVPRWVPDAIPDPGLARRWDAYLAALDVHEAGHRDLAVEAANEIHRTLETLRTGRCDVLAAEANARGRWVVERYRERNRQYDRETGHGRTQGADWPGPAMPGATHAGSPGSREGRGVPD